MIHTIQTRLWVRRGVVIGLQLHHHYKRWKTCKWCGNTFLPHHNKQAYCDNICKHISRQNYKSKWMYNRRVRNRNGNIINDRAILNVGTGGLGEHSSKDFSVEHRKIIKEMRELGLK